MGADARFELPWRISISDLASPPPWPQSLHGDDLRVVGEDGFFKLGLIADGRTRFARDSRAMEWMDAALFHGSRHTTCTYCGACCRWRRASPNQLPPLLARHAPPVLTRREGALARPPPFQIGGGADMPPPAGTPRGVLTRGGVLAWHGGACRCGGDVPARTGRIGYGGSRQASRLPNRGRSRGFTLLFSLYPSPPSTTHISDL